LVDPAKKIAIIKRNWLGRLDKDGGASQWTYPIIVAPELLFDVIKAYPGIKLDSVNTKGQNRLHLCTILMLGKNPGRCSLEHFNYLVKNLPIKAEDHDGMTALNYVTESFHKKRSVRSRRKAGTEDNAINALKTLVKTGADVNHKNGKGQTTLMRALSHREYKISEALLDLDADVNAKDTEGHNAIYFVFFERTKSRWHKDKYNFKLDENRKNILSLLAQKGVKIDSPDLKGESIENIALKHGAVKIVQFLETLSDLKSITNPP
jgi:ankyrin repeat protein